jgi:hypothetical protein
VIVLAKAGAKAPPTKRVASAATQGRDHG